MPKEKKVHIPKVDRTTLLFLKLIGDHCLPMPELEHRFHETRRWRIDYAWPNHKLAVEREGGIWVRGRHTRPQGFLKDLEKYNELTLKGWRLLRFTPKDLITMDAIKKIGTVLSL